MNCEQVSTLTQAMIVDSSVLCDELAATIGNQVFFLEFEAHFVKQMSGFPITFYVLFQQQPQFRCLLQINDF